ncbi:hypothetical protein TNCV_1623371 [Trichonephila clavipes]|nr:hypothetical protein TNCV_1623371 [Trichonephila clavipes]
MCSRRHGGGRVRSTTPAEPDISSYQQKEQAHHSSAGGKSVSCCLRKADLEKLLPDTPTGSGASGTAYRPENIQKSDRYPTCSIMVWAGTMINGQMRLHVVVNGTMTGQRYIDEVLLPHVRLSVVLSEINLFLWTTTQTCHRTLAVQDCQQRGYSTSRMASVLQI